MNTYLFAGQQRDSATGLDYLLARYLNTETGRFESRDLSPGTLLLPISLHRFLYASNNPVTRVDPSGLDDFSLGGLFSALSVTDILISASIVGFAQSSVAAGGGLAVRYLGLPAIEWDGVITSGGAILGLGIPSVGTLHVSNGTREATYEFISFAEGISNEILTVSNVKIYTPMILGTSPALLTGAFAVVDSSFVARELNGVGGKSVSYTGLTVGFGVGFTSDTRGASIGISIGAGFCVLVGD